jgi:hypothetical protein
MIILIIIGIIVMVILAALETDREEKYGNIRYRDIKEKDRI